MSDEPGHNHSLVVVAIVVAAVVIGGAIFASFFLGRETTVASTVTTTANQTSSESSGTPVQCIQTGIHGTLYVRVATGKTDQPVSGARVTARITNYCTPDYRVTLGITNSSGYSDGWTWTGGFVVSVVYAGTNYTFPAQTSGAVSLVTLSVPSGVAVEKTIACYGLGCGSGTNVTAITASLSPVSATAAGESSSVAASFASPANESFQFVRASVSKDGTSVAVNATFRSELPASTSVSVVGVAYSAVTGNPYGIPDGVVCCPLVRSYSQTEAAAASNKVEPGAHAQFSSTLLLPSLEGTYVVKLYIASPNGSLLLSPISNVFLQVTGGTVEGGQAGSGPTFFDSDDGLLYVADAGIDAITVINGSTSRIVATISLPDVIGGSVGFYLYDPGNHELYVGVGDFQNSSSTDVYAVNTSSNFIVSRFPSGEPGQSPGPTVYDPLRGTIFWLGYSQVSVFNDSTNKIIANIAGIQGPVQGAFDPKNGDVYVQAYNGTIFVIDGNSYSITGRIVMPSMYLSQFVYDPDNGLFYLAKAQVPYTLLMINATSNDLLQREVPLNSTGAPFLYDPFSRDIYLYSGPAINSAGGELVAVSTESDSMVASIPVPGLNGGLVMEEPSFVYDASNGNIYATEIANPHNGTVGLLCIGASSNAIISQTFPPGMPLNYIALDAKDGVLYGAYGFGSSAIFGLNLASGAVTTIQVGTVQPYTLLP